MKKQNISSKGSLWPFNGSFLPLWIAAVLFFSLLINACSDGSTAPASSSGPATSASAGTVNSSTGAAFTTASSPAAYTNTPAPQASVSSTAPGGAVPASTSAAPIFSATKTTESSPPTNLAGTVSPGPSSNVSPGIASPAVSPSTPIAPSVAANKGPEIKVAYTTPRQPGHNKSVNSLDVSPDKRYLVTGGDQAENLQKRFLRWDLITDQSLPDLEGQQAGDYNPLFSPDGLFLGAIGADGSVKLWDASAGNGKLVKVLKSDNQIKKFGFSPDSKIVAGASDTSLTVWNLPSFQSAFKLNTPVSLFENLVISTDGQFLAASYHLANSVSNSPNDNGILVWSLKSGKTDPVANLRGHTDLIYSLSFSADNKSLTSVAKDNTIRRWDLGSLKEAANLNFYQGTLKQAAVSPAATVIATVREDKDYRIELWDAAIGNKLKDFNTRHTAAPPQPDATANNVPTSGYSQLKFSQDGQTLMALGADGIVDFLDVGSSELLHATRVIGDKIYFSNFSLDDKVLTTVFYNSIKRWEVKSGNLLSTYRIEPFSQVAFSPDDTMLAEADLKGLRLRDINNGRIISTANYPEGDVQAVKALSFVGGSKLLAVAREKDLALWDASNGLKKVDNTPGDISGVEIVFSPDGTVMAANRGSNPIFKESEGYFRLWDVKSGYRLIDIKPSGGTALNSNLTFTADNKRLVSYTNNGIKLWDVKTGISVSTLNASFAPNFALSPDDKLIAYTADLFYVVDVAQNQEIISRVLPANTKIMELKFSHTNKVLAGFGQNGSISLLQIPGLTS